MSSNNTQSLTEDNIQFLEFVYELAIMKGHSIVEAVNLSEMALFKRQFEGIHFSSLDERKLRNLIGMEHH
jgi:hypothetical protein